MGSRCALAQPLFAEVHQLAEAEVLPRLDAPEQVRPRLEVPPLEEAVEPPLEQVVAKDVLLGQAAPRAKWLQRVEAPLAWQLSSQL